MRNRLGSWVLALSTALTASACDEDSAGGAVSARVIVVVPLTGTFASRGEAELAALRMGVSDLEQAGLRDAIGGSFELVPVDCGPGRDVANAATRELIEAGLDGGVPSHRAIISSTTTCMEASLPLAIEFGIPHFEVSSGNLNRETYDTVYGKTHDHSTLDSSWSFSTRGACIEGLADAAAELLALRTDWQKIMILRGNKVHDASHTVQLRATLEVLGQTSRVMNATDIDLPYEGSYEAQLKALMVDATEKPDAIFFHLNGDSTNLRFLGDAKRAGYQGAIVTCGMARSMPLITPAENGNISDYLAGRLYFAMRSPPKSDANTAFKSDYKTFSGLDATTFTPSTYDAMILLGLGLAAAGKDADNAAVRDAILQVSKEGETVGYRELDKGVITNGCGPSTHVGGRPAPR